jgi:hypothetical protein
MLGRPPIALSFSRASFVQQILTQDMRPVSSRLVVVNSTFRFVEEDDQLQYIYGTVSANDSFVYSTSGNGWLISQETWNFLTYSASVVQGGAG